MTSVPAPRPCGSCPYRRDVPSGVWAEDEYAKLPPYDGESWEQPFGVFYCHQADGRVCAGWAAVHPMTESLALRLAAASGRIPPEEFEAILDYTTDVPLFGSGAEAAAHGLAEVEAPTEEAGRVIAKLARRRGSGYASP